MRSDFYVYVIFREDGSPCYVGKGCGNRIYQHERGLSHNTKLTLIIESNPQGITKAKLKENMTEADAFELEKAMIAAWGREVDGGPLVNIKRGGEGRAGPFDPIWVREQRSKDRKLEKLIIACSDRGGHKTLLSGVKKAEAQWLIDNPRTLRHYRQFKTGRRRVGATQLNAYGIETQISSAELRQQKIRKRHKIEAKERAAYLDQWCPSV